MKFRKKPVVIEAWQFDGCEQSAREILALAGPNSGIEHRRTTHFEHPHILVIATLEGEMRAFRGDWIIKGVKGEFYPCKPDVFEATYEVAP